MCSEQGGRCSDHQVVQEVPFILEAGWGSGSHGLLQKSGVRHGHAIPWRHKYTKHETLGLAVIMVGNDISLLWRTCSRSSALECRFLLRRWAGLERGIFVLPVCAVCAKHDAKEMQDCVKVSPSDSALQRCSSSMVGIIMSSCTRTRHLSPGATHVCTSPSRAVAPLVKVYTTVMSYNIEHREPMAELPPRPLYPPYR